LLDEAKPSAELKNEKEELKKVKIKKASESVDGFKILEKNDNQWLQLREIDGYIYSHEIRCHGMIVVILPYCRIGKDAWKFLLREETTPCWGTKPVVSAMTGGVEYPEATIKDAQRELYEEAGYQVSESELVFLGTCRASKSADTVYYLYTVDLTGKPSEKPQGDGNEGDLAPLKWIVTFDNIQDAQAMAAYYRMQLKLGVY
jgi:8-oxo-dGTP pyrophosphatase MutT (NUDIX family)